MDSSLISAVEEGHAARWREWQRKNEVGQRQGARQARLVFTVLFIALGVWLGLQLVS
jgi:hypothetical protein